jgi:hypothetical protein
MDGRRFRKAALGGVLCLFLALVHCDGDGPSGVTGLDVAGAWIEVSTVVDDGCELGFDEVSTTSVTIIPSGSQITFVFHPQGGDVAFQGTFDSGTGNFVLTIIGPGGSIVQSGRFSSNTRYTSETVITLIAESCTTRTSEVGQRSS